MLLNEEFTCATPAAMFLETFFLACVYRVPLISPPLFLLTGNGLCRAFASASVGVMYADRERAGYDGDAGRGSNQGPSTFDVHLRVTAQITFDGKFRRCARGFSELRRRTARSRDVRVDAYSFADCFS